MRTGVTVYLSPTDRKRLQAIVDDRNSPQTLPAHASPTDAKRSHHSARLRWVTFWVTQKSHRVKAMIAEGFAVEVRVLSRAFLTLYLL